MLYSISVIFCELTSWTFKLKEYKKKEQKNILSHRMNMSLREKT